MARVIIEFDSDAEAQAFVDDLKEHGYVSFGDSGFDAYGSAAIADDSPIQPTPPKSLKDLMREKREGVQAVQRDRLAAYVKSRTQDAG